ncbi:hypothetical protein CITRIK5_50229 [Citricoccus sp. K5]|nr:hypothetical protein CITRIK5_50229 [Citricoccus sp. K5]
MGQSRGEQESGEPVRVLCGEPHPAVLVRDGVGKSQLHRGLLGGAGAVPHTGDRAVTGIEDLVHGAVHHLAAGAHQHDPVGEVRGLLEEMGGEDHRAATLGLGLHGLPELLAGSDVHAGGGLVQEQQVRFGQQGECEAQPLLFAAGALADLPAGDLCRAGPLEGGLDRDVAGLAGGDHGHGLLDRQVAQQATGLEHGADPALEHGLLRRHPENREGAGRRGGEAEDQVEERGLAGTVGSEQGHDLTSLDLQVDAVDGPDGAGPAAELTVDAGGVEGGAGRVGASRIGARSGGSPAGWGDGARDGAVGCGVHASSLWNPAPQRICRASPMIHDIRHG